MILNGMIAECYHAEYICRIHTLRNISYISEILFIWISKLEVVYWNVDLYRDAELNFFFAKELTN